MTNIYKRDQNSVFLTIQNISAWGRCKATEFDFSNSNEVTFTLDSSDCEQVSAVCKTLCVWLKGKNQNIYVERFVNLDETSITIENPMLRTEDIDDNGNPIPSKVIDSQDRVRDGSCIVQEFNIHEADGDEITNWWDKVKPGAFVDYVTDNIVTVDGSLINRKKLREVEAI